MHLPRACLKAQLKTEAVSLGTALIQVGCLPAYTQKTHVGNANVHTTLLHGENYLVQVKTNVIVFLLSFHLLLPFTDTHTSTRAQIHLHLYMSLENTRTLSRLFELKPTLPIRF